MLKEDIAIHVLSSWQAAEAVDEEESFIERTMISNGGGNTSEARALVLLGQASQTPNGSLKLGPFLGSGGMGVVRDARQMNLGRVVAIKSLRPEKEHSERAMISMLREAWVTGMLEHPNIVPVHDVNISESGKPQIVLKKINGMVWTRLISDAEAVKEKFSASDLLRWNLAVLEKIVDAIRYAHSRGVIHRDLKPSNVMVGSFGEVYLMDWGIAVSLLDDGETLLPIVGEVDSEIVGTPGYMAPEMLEANEVDERTDIYLLGGLLYHILMGRTPHKGPNVNAIVASIRASTPVFHKNLPEGLVEICRKAMAANPSDRYQSAACFGKALQDFKIHQTSLCLSNRATLRLRVLRETAKAVTQSEDLHKELGQCQFGFQSALEAWSENSDAKQGLHEAVEIVAEVELRHGDPRIALRMLKELAAPNEDLLCKVKKSVRAITQADALVADIETQMDKELGRGVRLFLTVMFGFGWIWMDLWAIAFNHSELTHQLMIGATVFHGIGVAGLVYMARHTLRKTSTNRHFVVTLFVILVCQVMASTAGQALGASPEQVYVSWMLIWLVSVMMSMVTIDRSIWPTALAIGLCYLVTSISMDLRWLGLTGLTLATIGNGLFVWMPTKSESGEQFNLFFHRAGEKQGSG